MSEILSVPLFALAAPAFPQAKNVILFVGDGAGVSSLNAASIYGEGFLLIAHSDCHLGKGAKSLQRIVQLDQAIAKAAEEYKSDTLILFTADHSYDLRIKGENLAETARDFDHKEIVLAVSLEGEHTAEEVPLVAAGPGSERVHGFIANTDIFHLILGNFGWEK